MPKALIIGGGVAGPAAALFLRRAGWEAEIFEARHRPDAFGGLFLNVATNGLAVLDTLGLKARLLEDGHLSPYMEMHSGRGRKLGTVPNGPAGEPERGSVVVRREWLNAVLREATGNAGIPLTWGARLERIEETPDGVTAHFADGSQATGDILIGCDGVGSPTRRWIDPEAPDPAYSGLLSIGGFARVDGLEPTPLTQHMVFGTRGFFGYLVRDDGTVYWFANPARAEMDRDALRAVPGETWLDELRAVHSEDPYPVPQILDNATGAVGAYGIYELPHVPHWHRGRVVAVGDAVHATSPSAGQGASLALEDAETLALCLRDLSAHEQAFARYQQLRQRRAEDVVKYSRAISRQKTATSSKLAVLLRDALLPLFLRGATRDTRNNHLYNHVIRWERSALDA
ncbi:FAD-dependent oxidoreductase [Microbacterium azadirachtae]|uniref:FAD-dependent oxidoreductase n=1 Tax=Microbacterium azadirachtae TaxID=582680 RepID=UPI0008831360|nr:FAD-dependent monooxygenase [Microbacterium azadirachtae]SDL73544.1 2-polyprenyl-6-methoxyphenol hydroxylase [Microbacterium azadirachtae]SEG02867.1 2-polyprenyl-6-methoxyphenol hydroxylase [Microbacterium azadirachtae]SEG05563.1 2-polyprenyl-6-methoxyphenol hydroxylase [Microbacterium azadirachtae]